MTDSRSFLDRLAKVPTHVMLTPGVHLQREGDLEYIDSEEGWLPIDSNCYGCAADTDGIKRPIPEHIRRSAAWWGLYNSLATVAPDHLGIAYLYCLINRKSGIGLVIDLENRMRHGIRKFESSERCRDAVPILGGEETIIHFLSEGPLLDSWMGEQ